MSMVVCSNEFVSVQFDRLQHLLELVWAPVFTPSRRLRPILTELGGFLKVNRPQRWLCDHSGMKIISPEDQAWIVDEWLPAWRPPTMPSVRKLAMVRPVDVFGQLSVSNVTKRIAERCAAVELRWFEDRNAAGAWLKGIA
jgi:hypothetical protein